MSGEANNVMKKILQKMVNHVLSSKEFKDIAMCQTIYGMKIQTDLPKMIREEKIRNLQSKVKKMADTAFQQSVCATDIIFEND